MPVNVDLPLPVNIPVSYVPDRDTRLRLYRRIADLTTIPEIEALTDEFTDRFGVGPTRIEESTHSTQSEDPG